MQTITIKIQWRLLQRPPQCRQVPAGISLAALLADVLTDIKPDEVLTVFNGRPVTLKDTLDTDGVLELIPMLCGG